MFLRMIGALAAGGAIGFLVVLQGVRDDHLVAMYDCAHAYHDGHPELSLEQSWIACEKAAR